jgi:hypothetical protein
MADKRTPGRETDQDDLNLDRDDDTGTSNWEQNEDTPGRKTSSTGSQQGRQNPKQNPPKKK